MGWNFLINMKNVLIMFILFCVTVRSGNERNKFLINRKSVNFLTCLATVLMNEDALSIYQNDFANNPTHSRYYRHGSGSCICTKGDKCCCPKGWRCCNSTGKCCCRSQ